MKVGYARVSTAGQALESQLEELTKAGADKILQEKVSASTAQRPQLETLLDFIREGDQVIVTRLDRLARSTQDLLNLQQQIEAKGATLKILAINLDTGNATGQMMLTILAAIAEFERCLMLERQRDGIAKAKAAGKYKGRKPTAQAKAEQVLKLAASGATRQQVAVELGMSERSVYRILKQQQQKA